MFLKNVTIQGSKVGIRVGAGARLFAENVTFRDVDQPYVFEGDASGAIVNNQVNFSGMRRVSDVKRFVGWRNSSGPSLLSRCSHCGITFSSEYYKFTGQFWLLWNNTEPCVNCDRQASLDQGLYQILEDIANIIIYDRIDNPDLLKIFDDYAQDKISERELKARLLQSDKSSHRKILKYLASTPVSLICTVFLCYTGWLNIEISKDAVQVSKDALQVSKDAQRVAQKQYELDLDQKTKGEIDSEIRRKSEALLRAFEHWQIRFQSDNEETSE
jgi:hypothetical protein